MVPVPEELVDQVTTYMAWKLSGPKIAENPDAVRLVFDQIDSDLRNLILHVAQATVAGSTPTLLEVSAAIDMPARQIIGSLSELAVRLQAAGRANFLLLARADPRERPEGVEEWEHRVLVMADADAEVVVGF